MYKGTRTVQDFDQFVQKRHNSFAYTYPDSKVHGANVGPTWGRQDPGGPHVGHTNFAIWVLM